MITGKMNPFTRRGLLILPGIALVRAQNASHAAELVNEARKARKSGDFSKSLSLLKEAFGLTTPDDDGLRARILFERAAALDGLGETLTALQVMEDSLELKEDPIARRYMHELQDKLASNPELASKGLKGAFEAAKEVRIVRRGGGAASVKSWVNFKVMGHLLEPGAVRQAEILVGHMSEPAHKGYKFVVVGHTDTTGSDEINDPLSLRRAITVLEFARKAGIPMDRLRAQGKGKRQPLRPGNSDADHTVNRRVEVVLERV